MRVAVVGAGLMGHGIAQVFLVAGHDVRITDNNREVLEDVRQRIRANLRALGMDEEMAERLEVRRDLAEALAGAEVVFEAVYEDLALKQDLFRTMERLVDEEALLATNTSVMRISEIVAKAESRGRMLGTHWWNPPYLVPLVEVTPSEWTQEGALARMMALLASVGKVPVHVRKDVPGFIGNRLQHALWREAFALVDEGICDPETVDVVIQASFGLRLPVLGPVANADLVGLDLTLAIHRYILPHLSRAKEPSRTLQERVAAGQLGVKSGQGFRRWTKEEAEDLRRRLDEHLRRSVAALRTSNGDGRAT